ncbi:MAG: M14 family zinc carboxypeptidase [Bacteriovoracaceae bacterium]
MKGLFFVLALVLISATALAGIKIEEEVYVLGHHPDIIKDMVQTGSVEIDHVTSKGFEAYGSKGLREHLVRRGLPVLDMPKMNKALFADYPTHTQMTNTLKSIVEKYPGIMKMESIGKSVKGKDLWVIKISKNVEKDEVKPEFKYISSMHGDEITGRELMVSLIAEIGERFTAGDAEVTKLVNNTEIFIMPSMNPDGSEARRRANANGSDLNRNFPDIISDTESSARSRQLEVQHVMKWQEGRKFSLSANFHGGAVVVNYPWDSKKARHPLDAFVQDLSNGYAATNKPMVNSREFEGGITNGADWYVVRGGMQDWSYNWHNDLQLTVELSDEKWPSYALIPQFYKDNRESLFYYMNQIHRGAGFTLSKKGVSGSVKVVQTSPETMDLGNFAFSGSEFYKVLPVGVYEFTISPQGGETQVIQADVSSKVLVKSKYQKVKFQALQ